MTGRRVEDRLRKKQRAGRIGAGDDNIVVETFRIDHAAVCDREDKGNSFRELFVDL